MRISLITHWLLNRVEVGLNWLLFLRKPDYSQYFGGFESRHEIALVKTTNLYRYVD